MAIKVCVAGATGWTGGAVTKSLIRSNDFELTGAIARRTAGKDIGSELGLSSMGVIIRKTLEEATEIRPDVLVDYSKPDSVKQRVFAALEMGIRVVIGTSGLNASDFREIETIAKKKKLGVISAGNFSLTAALVKHFALLAARHIDACEIIDYGIADKPDAPSGTTIELAEAISNVRKTKVFYPVEKIHGKAEARGADIGSTRVHSMRLPNFTSSFEVIFGLSNESLTIRHDSGSGADPYVKGTLLAIQKVMTIQGLIRGLDRLLFENTGA